MKKFSLFALALLALALPAVAADPPPSVGAYGNLTASSFISLSLIQKTDGSWTQYPGGVGWNAPTVGYFTGGLGASKPVFIAGHAMVHLTGRTMAGKSATCDIDETNDGIGVTVREGAATVYSKAFGPPSGSSPAKLSVTAPAVPIAP